MAKIVRTIRRDCTKRGPNFTMLPDGYVIADIEVEVDLDAIAQKLGGKAIKNKSGKATYLDGNVVVKVVRRERHGATQ